VAASDRFKLLRFCVCFSRRFAKFEHRWRQRHCEWRRRCALGVSAARAQADLDARVSGNDEDSSSSSIIIENESPQVRTWLLSALQSDAPPNPSDVVGRMSLLLQTEVRCRSLLRGFFFFFFLWSLIDIGVGGGQPVHEPQRDDSKSADHVLDESFAVHCIALVSSYKTHTDEADAVQHCAVFGRLVATRRYARRRDSMNSIANDARPVVCCFAAQCLRRAKCRRWSA
jgi:hypothetical protein